MIAKVELHSTQCTEAVIVNSVKPSLLAKCDDAIIFCKVSVAIGQMPSRSSIIISFAENGISTNPVLRACYPIPHTKGDSACLQMWTKQARNNSSRLAVG